MLLGVWRGARRGLIFSWFVFGLVEVINKFFSVLVIGQFEFQFAFLGAEHDRLAFHPPDHIERRPRLAAQCHLEDVFLDAGLHGLAQLALDFEEPISRTKPFDALVRAFVVVMFDPELDALAGGVEALELRSGQEVLPDGRPEAFDLSQGHGMLRA